MLFSLQGIVPYLTQFLGEVEKKLYNPLTFYIIISLYQLPFYVFIYMILVFPVMIFVDLDFGDFYLNFFPFTFTLYLTCFSGSGIGDIFSLTTKDIDEAVQLSALPVAPATLLSGYYIGFFDVNIFLKILSYLSTFKFGY